MFLRPYFKDVMTLVEKSTVVHRRARRNGQPEYDVAFVITLLTGNKILYLKKYAYIPKYDKSKRISIEKSII